MLYPVPSHDSGGYIPIELAGRRPGRFGSDIPTFTDAGSTIETISLTFKPFVLPDGPGRETAALVQVEIKTEGPFVTILYRSLSVLQTYNEDPKKPQIADRAGRRTIRGHGLVKNQIPWSVAGGQFSPCQPEPT